MKFLNKICGIGLLAFLLMLAAPNKSKAQDEGGYVSDQEFYDQLDPYGTWVDDPAYGNVWVPDAGDDFRPYATQGHWVVTDYGNTWVSDYPWGWATFHYGRWRYDDYYGWEWIPGHEWAPAWVSWRSGGGYYGWAPLQPGISISLSFGSSYNVPDNYWVCAPQAYIASPTIYNYYVPHTRVVNIIHRTTIINNTYVYNKRTYVTGPRINEIRQVTHNRNVKVYNITNNNRPDGGGKIVNNTVNIYRPQIRKSADARPARVVDANAYRTQHPDYSIAHRGNRTNGQQTTVDHNNAARLKEIARTDKPDNKVVRVNPTPANNNRPGNNDNRRPGQQGNVQGNNNANPAQPNNNNRQHPGQNNQGNNNTVNPAQPNANPNNNNNRHTRQDNRGNMAPIRQDQQNNTTNGQPAPTRPADVNNNHASQPAAGTAPQQTQQQEQQRAAHRQQQMQQHQQQQAQQNQQQNQDQAAQRQQQLQQRQQQEQQRAQQNQQQQAQKEQQRQQQMQQRQQAQQQQAQRQQQQAQQQQQAAQQNQQRQQQQAQQQAQRQQQMQQRQQQQAQQQAQRQQQEQQRQQQRQQPAPAQENH